MGYYSPTVGSELTPHSQILPANAIGKLYLAGEVLPVVVDDGGEPMSDGEHGGLLEL